MKKVILLFLAAALLLSGCSIFNFMSKRKVPTPLTQADIDAIPIATADMSEEELRQICLDFFRLQLTFQWTPKESFAYTITTYDKDRKFEAGTIYAGLPYQGSFGSGSLYLAMEYYDQKTGVLDNTGISGPELSQLLGNHCTTSPYWAWTRVVNSTKKYSNAYMTKYYGFLPVGDYQYETPQWTEQVQNTKEACKQNGEQVMFEAFAQLEPADGILMFLGLSGNSHCRMVSASPVVVRDSDGAINGEESYILYMDQGSSLKDYTAADGSTVQLQGKVDQKATFAQLFDKGYVPFTFAEFVGTDPVEPSQVTLQLPSQVTTDDLLLGTISSNYPISYLEVTLTDAQDNQTYRVFTPADAIDIKEMLLGKSLSLSDITPLLEQGDQTVTVQVRISTGELITAYQGTLTKKN